MLTNDFVCSFRVFRNYYYNLINNSPVKSRKSAWIESAENFVGIFGFVQLWHFIGWPLYPKIWECEFLGCLSCSLKPAVAYSNPGCLNCSMHWPIIYNKYFYFSRKFWRKLIMISLFRKQSRSRLKMSGHSTGSRSKFVATFTFPLCDILYLPCNILLNIYFLFCH